MAILLQVRPIGNQIFRSSYNSYLYEWSIQWNERVSRFYLTVENISTGASIVDQSIEPFSVCTLTNLGLGDLYLLPAMVSPRYNENGDYAVQYEDIGSNLKLILVSADDIKTLENIYGPVTILPGLLT